MATLPNPNPLTNNAVANYQYFIDPTTIASSSGANISNDVSTFVNVADAQITKFVSQSFADVGNVLTYTMVINNAGNMTANNVILSDTTPNGTTFVTDSVSVNGTNQTGVVPDPPTGITVGNILPNSVATVTWNVTVATIPNPNPIPNTGTNTFSYLVDPVAGTTITSGNNSNIVNTQVNNANISGSNLVKSANPTNGQVGTIVTYTIFMFNSGNATASNVVFTDTIPNSTSFVANSVTINGAAQSGANPAPPTGVAVPNIPPLTGTTLTFNVTLTALPTVNPIPNTGKVAYSYTVNPTIPNGGTSQNLTNVANVFTNQAVIDNTNGGGLVKAVDSAFANVGQILTYTIALNNTGNVTADNVVLTDTIPNGTSFTGAVFVNGNIIVGANPQTGIGVGSIPPGVPSLVLFQVVVNTIPSPNPIPNNSTVNFDYTSDPLVPDGASGSGNSNTVRTQVNQATIDNSNGGGLTKAVNTNFSKVGDVLTYTIGIKNTGNVSAQNVVFTDTIPSGTSLVTNSVTLNGVTQAGASPDPSGTGVAVGTVLPLASSTITFQVVINTIPNPNPIPNNGTVNYNYQVNPANPNVAAGGNTNIVNTQVNQATIDNTNGGGLVKAVDKAFAKLGDVLTYSINLTNTGNVTANNVTIVDTTPNGTFFVPNSVTLNGAPQVGAVISPPSGFNAGSIAPGATSLVTFNVVVTTNPNPNPIPNAARVAFTFTQIPTVPNGASGTGNSNIVNTQVNSANIDNVTGGLTKFVDKAFADVGDVLNYTIVLKNTGTTNANNVVFTDTIPSGTTFVTDSVTLNGTTQSGVNPAPGSGVNVGTIIPLGVSTITFQVTVITIPTPNPIPNNGTVNFVYTLDPSSPDGATGSGNTNTVNTQVNSANFNNGAGGITKFVDKTSAKSGDILTYTIVLTNTGNVASNNILFTDTIPSGTTFVANSLKVNNVVQTGASPAPPTGINVGSINPGATTTIVFTVNVTGVPAINPIPNSGKASYTYTVNPAVPNGKAAQNLTNIVNTTISQADINGASMVKTVSSAFAQVGQILTYTIALGNTGNVTANNVVLTDTIPNGTSFVSGSVFVNGNPSVGANPQSGIAVGSVAPGALTAVSFQVTVTTIPTPNPTPNNSTVRYNYTIDPAFPDGASGSGNSNTVTTQVSQATIDNKTGGGLVKFVNPNFAKVSDTVTYTIVLKNTGNVVANNVLFTDTIPNNTTFVNGSVFVNNVAQPSFNPTPPSGFTVGSIAAGASSTVVFKVTVDTIPSPNPIPNTATAVYNFTVDPAFPNAVTASGNTNFVLTQVNQAIVNNATGGLVKTVDKANASVGDVLNYTIVVNNTGNTSADNVVVTDTIPSGTTFVTNSVFLNNVNVLGANPAPPTGISVGTVGPLGVSTITFQVVVNTIPTPNPIPNSGTTNFKYTVDPAFPDGQNGSGNSNIVNTQVNQATIDNKNGSGLVKFVDKAFADVGDVLNYTIVLKNTGNVAANNVIFTDTIPSGTTFVANSVVLNGVNQGAVAPDTGIAVGTINPLATSTILFQVTVITIPTPNPIPNNGTVNYVFTGDPAVVNGRTGSGNTNTVNTQVNSANFNNGPGGISKTVNKANAKVNDVLTYTIVLTNTGNVASNNVVVTDTIPSGTTFVANSVVVNNVPQSGANIAPPVGVNVGSINAGATTTVVFNVVVNTIPTPNPILNQGKASYTYTVNPAIPNGKAAQNLTNIPATQVNQATIDNSNGGGLVKFVDKAFAKINDVINYTIVLKNTGNVAANNVVFSDTIPSGTTFVANSVFVDSVNVPGANPAPASGVTVSTIAALGVSTISFQVTVITIPTPNPIANNGTVNYSFTVDPLVPNGASGSGNTNKVTTQVNTAIIDNNGVNGNGMNKTVNTAFATIGDILNYSVVLKNTGNVAANNVVFTDTIPNGGVFVNNSFAINGAVQLGANPAPPTGVNVGTINPGQAVTLTFNATVVSLPIPNPMVNSSTTNYTYTLDPAIPNGQSTGGNSNSVTTQVNGGFNPNTGGLVKSVSKAFAQINDVLTYYIAINNNGNTTLGNILIKDTIPNGTAFNLNSVSIDGVSKPGFNPQVGITIGTLAVGITTTIAFNVTVTSTIPTPNPVPNNNVMTYTYTVNPSFPNGKASGAISNTVNTQINSAIINNSTGGLIKAVSKNFADVNDILTYTIFLKNTGNVAANNVVVSDTIPSGTVFQSNTVTVNGAVQPGSDPGTGINIPILNPNTTATISFQVVVNTIPTPNPMINNGIVNYQYTIDPAVVNGGNATNISNNVNTQVNNANFNGPNGQGGVTKFVDKAFAQVNDVLSYTIVLQNSGNVSATNVVLKDTIPNGTTFVNNSVTVNTVAQSGANPQTGVNVGTIVALGASTISFKVVVNTIPTINPIPNSGFINFNYTTDPAVLNGKSGGASSNIVNTQVNQATIDNSNGNGLVKAVDKAFAKVNDVLTYTITLGNTGNVAADNVIFTDTIPSGTTFVANSVFVDNVNVPGASPAPGSGVTIATIAPLASSIISFKVVVNTIPSPNPIPNNGTVNYKFTKDPSVIDGASGSGNTNKVTTQVNTAIIDNNGVNGNGLNKSVTPTVAAIGDIITYTIVAKNTGNVAATSVVVTDTIPTGTTFVNNSVFLNNINQPGVNPETGVPVGTLNAGQAATITFRVLIGQTIPNPNPILNSATTTYKYTMDPANPNGENGSGNSNIVPETVNSAIINNSTGGGLVKTVSKVFAKTKDILTYTISIGNTGNVTANNVVISDTIPSGTTLVLNSVVVDGVVRPGINPQNGVSINNIPPGATSTMVFNVQVGATVPTPNPIPNDARAAFTFTVIPTVPNGRTGGGISNKVTTQINSAIIDNKEGGGAVKSASPSFADIGDIVTYTISLKNTGNVAANNIVVTDTIPNGTTFVENSIVFNGAPQPGSVIAPPVGFAVGSLAPGQGATITFNVLVVTLPIPNPMINTATNTYSFTEDPAVPDGAKGSGNTNLVPVQVNNGGLDPAKGGFSKTVNKQFVAVGDIVTYTIAYKNTGNVSINNVVISDTIPSGTNFVVNSLVLNGVTQSGVNPQSGVNVGSLGSGAAGIITFNVLVTTIPTPNPIPNNATSKYTYTVSPTLPNGKAGGSITNIVTTQVNQATIDNKNGSGLVKSVDKAFAEVGDTLNYSFVVKNTGNVAANNVLLTDTIPNGTVYIPGSATVNGSAVSIISPNAGIPVGNVASGATSTVAFSVAVVSIPSPNPMPNSGTVNYNFIVDPINAISRNGSGNSNTVNSQINEAVIDNKVGGGFVKYVSEVFGDLGDVVTYTIVAKNTGNTAANNVVITDTIPNGTNFNASSVVVNGVGSPGANPQSGINIGSVGAGSASTVTFTVTVTTIPTPNPIPNSATANYNFTVNPNNPDGASASGNTNIVNTQINNAGFDSRLGGMTKYVDKNYAAIGDTLSYTTVLINTGSVASNNVIFIDTIPSGTAFVPNTVFVNGIIQLGLNPQNGINIGSVVPGVAATVVFNVTVTTLPVINPIPNNSNVTYNYVVDPSKPAGKNSSNLSNIVNTQVNDPNITPGNGGFIKTPSKQYATIGDIITYTVNVKNPGNTAANNIIIQDTVPVGTTFVPNTVSLNGIPQQGADPNVGVPAGSLLPGQSTVMTFNVVVTTIPLVNPIPNTANLYYTFTKDPSVPNGANGKTPSNTSNTTINAAVIDNKFGSGLVKSVDLAYADIGYVLNYSISLTNTGNVTAQNVILSDTIPSGTTLVGNSVTVNGTALPGVNPQNGVTVGTIAPSKTSIVTFKVNVITIPTPNPIPNSAVSTYSFVVNPTNPVLTTFKGLSNTVNTQVNNGTIDFNKGQGFVKTVDKAVAKIGDTLVYTLKLTNTGNTTVNNVVVVDTVPNGTAYVSGSATVNGNAVGITSPTSGIPVGSVGPSQTSTVVYSVKVTNIPSPNPIPNTASAKYTYTVNPSNPNGTTSGGNSNTVTTSLNQAIIDNNSGGFSKTANPTFADVGTTITYTIVAKNTGTVAANNVIITDPIPNGTNFVAGSVTINGVAQGSANPGSGVNIGTLAPNAVATMTFQVVVTQVPTTNPIANTATNSFTYTLDPANPNGENGSGTTNTSTTQVNHGEISNTSGGFVKSADKVCAGINDIITYTLFVKNTGNVMTTNVVIIDTIPNATTFVSNSVTVNGTTFSGVSPQSGINLNSIPPNGSLTVTFKVLVATLPATASTSNTALVKYNYTVNPSTPNGASASNVSNSVVTPINSAIIVGNGFTKAVDKAFADLGDILTYTLRLTNTGNANATNTIVYDTIPNGTTFVSGSITINGSPDTADNPQTGITIGTIVPGATVVVVYNVKVNSTIIPTPNPIPNKADVVYEYETCPGTLAQVRSSSTIIE